MEEKVADLQKRLGADLTTKQVTKWLNKLQRYMDDFSDQAMAKFQYDEIFQFVSRKDILKNRIPRDPELRYVQEQAVPPLPDHKYKLQTPQETFGMTEAPKGERCVKCHSTNTGGPHTIQDRSIDEPSAYYFQCRDCNHRWKHS